ncbi:polymorphic toxin type 17 domain-containing protein [Acidovorax sp. SUPP3334]|uniref:polymorphic toxin type 17 domain-containing protein n=1 Tax=Acidovorax sp. SUPP3334 TaxID=2920881 RepID=UPI0032EA64AC
MAQVYYFHNQPNGRPEELSDNRGNLVWRAQYKTWGSAVTESWQAFDDVGRPLGQAIAGGQAVAPQNLRMQGQYLDRETGLHYNTFRYYEPEVGAFTTPDPIGLAGGMNLHQYAPNPIAWVDPWGLARECGSAVPPSKKGAIKAAGLPTKGRIRYVPPKNWSPTMPLPKGKQNGYIDKFGNEWTKGPSRTQGQAHEWDVQLSKQGREKIGWTTRDGSHANVSLDGKITHK